MKIMKVTLLVFDHDNMGKEDVENLLDNGEHDEHPLNYENADISPYFPQDGSKKGAAKLL